MGDGEKKGKKKMKKEKKSRCTWVVGKKGKKKKKGKYPTETWKEREIKWEKMYFESCKKKNIYIYIKK